VWKLDFFQTKCNNCKVLKLRHDTARQLRICEEQLWDLRVPTDGGDTELPDAYRRNIKIWESVENFVEIHTNSIIVTDFFTNA
jgi:hypothetical protein